MKKLLILAATLSLFTLASQTVMANCGDCGSHGKKAKVDKAASSCSSKADCFAKLDLSEDQKAKVDALTADCEKTSCDKTSAKKMKAGLKDILTVNQYNAMTAECEKQGCPLSAGKKKSSWSCGEG